MNDVKCPDPVTVHPIAGYDKEIYVKPTVTNPNIIVGDFTYIADSDFESHVSYLYEWNDDKLIIGKFCQIAAGVEFVMNGANHQMNAVSTFPFYTLEGWKMSPPAKTDLPLKGDTVIGNDVWIGQNSVFLPGVHIGDGDIVGVCKKPDDNVSGSDLLKMAVANGGKKLDAFSKLWRFYTNNGFEPVSWTPFNKEYAPADWKEEYGEEPVIFYKYTGKHTAYKNSDEFLNAIKPNADYGEAMSIRDKEIEK